MRHHARQFGKSKYGLSRVYKVLLDLMVIKTVASLRVAAAACGSRCCRCRCLRIAMLALAHDAYDIFADGQDAFSLPIAGSGVIFLMLGARSSLCSGALGELIYKRGDLRDAEFFALTQRLQGVPANPLRRRR